jgi:hypothetical protein
METGRKKVMNEKQLHKQIIQYIELVQPKVIVQSDPNGVKLTMGQSKAAKAIRLPHEGGHPDIFVFSARKGYNGLFIEVKTESNNPFLKDGSISKSEHPQKQHSVHERLRKEGYTGGFAVGFDMAKQMIDDYFC